jgi:hypothetical protein
MNTPKLKPKQSKVKVVKYPIKVTPKVKHDPNTCEIALFGRCLSCEVAQ